MQRNEPPPPWKKKTPANPAYLTTGHKEYQLTHDFQIKYSSNGGGIDCYRDCEGRRFDPQQLSTTKYQIQERQGDLCDFVSQTNFLYKLSWQCPQHRQWRAAISCFTCRLHCSCSTDVMCRFLTSVIRIYFLSGHLTEQLKTTVACVLCWCKSSTGQV